MPTDPRTALGKRLAEIRKRIVASGTRLLTWAEVGRDDRPAREPNRKWKWGSTFMRAWYWEGRARLGERILKMLFSGKRIGCAHHMADLEEKVKTLQEVITGMRLEAERKNLELRATNLIVGCTAACSDASFENVGAVTEEFVATAERIVKRLRMWRGNRDYQIERGRKRND